MWLDGSHAPRLRGWPDTHATRHHKRDRVCVSVSERRRVCVWERIIAADEGGRWGGGHTHWVRWCVAFETHTHTTLSITHSLPVSLIQTPQSLGQSCATSSQNTGGRSGRRAAIVMPRTRATTPDVERLQTSVLEDID